jgi:hypothetical protein
MRKQKKSATKLMLSWPGLLEQHTKGDISDLQLAISCGTAVKTELIKK